MLPCALTKGEDRFGFSLAFVEKGRDRGTKPNDGMNAVRWVGDEEKGKKGGKAGRGVVGITCLGPQTFAADIKSESYGGVEKRMAMFWGEKKEGKAILGSDCLRGSRMVLCFRSYL